MCDAVPVSVTPLIEYFRFRVNLSHTPSIHGTTCGEMLFEMPSPKQVIKTEVNRIYNRRSKKIYMGYYIYI